jgi:two-component system, NtrC family, sensor histidine kinase HydH
MSNHNGQIKAVVICLMIGGILSMHYLTLHDMRYHHALYRMLFYVPLALGSLWFGMKGALYVCGSVSVLFLPHAIAQWQGFSLDDFSRLTEGVLYIIIALILGFLVEKERKEHRALRRTESLAAVGKTVSEIAHDMKTPLMAIGGFTRQVSRKLGKGDPNHKKLDIIIEETTRLESMVEEMLDFGKPMKLQLKDTNLNELVLDSIKVAKPLAKKAEVALKTDLSGSLPALALDAPRVKQMLLNLITNAVQASSEGEHVLVRTRPDNPWVVLEVVDDGRGITKEHHESIFHPFFSTKKSGTGLGLGIVKKIVETHGGEISFHPNAEKGVTFTVRFPIST